MNSVREFCDIAFGCLGLDYNKFVVTDPQFYRPAEVEVLQGNASKALRKFGWAPTIGLKEIISEMVDADMQRLEPGPCQAEAIK